MGEWALAEDPEATLEPFDQLVKWVTGYWQVVEDIDVDRLEDARWLARAW